MSDRTRSHRTMSNRVRTASLAGGLLSLVLGVPAAADGIVADAGGVTKPAAGVASISSFATDASLLGTPAAPVVNPLYQSTVAFSGVSFNRLEIQVPSAGTIDVRLSDLQFPAAAATLSFAITDGGRVLGVINGTGSLLDFSVAGPMTIFAYAYGVASAGFNTGAYTLEITHEVAPVPLPPALLLLLSGLGATGWLARRRTPARAAAATMAA